MGNIFLIFFMLIFLIFIGLLIFYVKHLQLLLKKIINVLPFISWLKGQEFNPDINTDNWDLHKRRLEKFRRSQYKGLTFFISKEDRIYYLSEKGTRIYC